LQAIRDRDAGFTDTENCAPAIHDRRRLLHALDSAVKMFSEVGASHQALVREMDWMINGAQAAPQASLCDIVSQFRAIKLGEFKFCQYGYAHPKGGECVGQCLRKPENAQESGTSGPN